MTVLVAVGDDSLSKQVLEIGAQLGRALDQELYISHDRTRSGKGVGRQLAEIAEDEAITHIVIGHRSKAIFERLRQGDTAFTVVPETLTR